MIAHDARALYPCTAVLAVSGGYDAAALLDVCLLPDPPDSPRGPLSSILAGLQWTEAERADWLVTATCDVPLAPPDMVLRLIEAAQVKDTDLAIVRTSDGPHPLCGAWRPRLRSRVAIALRHGTHPAVQQLAAEVPAAEVQFSERERFFNVNTISDLEVVERYLVDQRAHP